LRNAARTDFYTEYYRLHAGNERAQGWRALGARTNADYIEALLAGAEVHPERVVEIGCGDGALMIELARRGIGRSFVGYEISRSVVEFLNGRGIPELERAAFYDGENVPEPDEEFDLALVVNVVEHAPEPVPVLREAGRLARHAVVAIALEDTAAARRGAYRRKAAQIGHVQRFDRDSARSLLEEAGLDVLAETVTPPPIAHRTFWSDGRLERAKAYAGGGARVGLWRLSPVLSGRLFAVDYTCLCTASARPAPTGRFSARAPAGAPPP
jgi:SAM-dependent methyltransferase